MLRRNSNDSHLVIKNGIDSILKHKIRNLRAKLKNLLFSQSCSKSSKRVKMVKKMQKLQNKQFYTTNNFFNQGKHLFTHSKQQPKKFWYSQKQKCNVMNVLDKLTIDQIQQIKQDMNYYLGEDNVEKFKLFLQTKNPKKQNKLNMDNSVRRLRTLKQQVSQSNIDSQDKNIITTERIELDTNKLPKFGKNSSITDNFCNFRHSFEANLSYQTNKLSDPSNKRLKTANLLQSRNSTVTKCSNQFQRYKFQANYLGNKQYFLNRRRIIDQQQNAQRVITKIAIQTKQEKAQDVVKITQQTFLRRIRQNNTRNDSKTRRILQDKYKKNVTFGSIVQLNEKLRKIYIKKISSNEPAPFIQSVKDDHNYQNKIYNKNS